jgi:hypothetical protein
VIITARKSSPIFFGYRGGGSGVDVPPAPGTGAAGLGDVDSGLAGTLPVGSLGGGDDEGVGPPGSAGTPDSVGVADEVGVVGVVDVVVVGVVVGVMVTGLRCWTSVRGAQV